MSNTKQQITQWIFGTGGGELDSAPNNNECIYNENNIHVKLNILSNVVYNSDDKNISEQFTKPGVAEFGYGEILFNLNFITHKFIKTNHNIDRSTNMGYKSKYLKYKSKYIELKKITNY